MRKEAVFQVNHCLPNFLITGEQIIVIDGNFQVFVLWEEACHFKHSVERTENGYMSVLFNSLTDLLRVYRAFRLWHSLPAKHWVECIRHIVVSVINRLFPQRDFDVWVTLKKKRNVAFSFYLEGIQQIE